MPPEKTAHPATALPQDVSAEGVDLSLIRWSLSLSPLERLQHLQGFLRGLAALQNARRA